MIDKKKLKDVMKKQDLKQEKPTDPSMTLDVKNEDVEAQIDLYLKEKTGENLNALIELMRTRRVLVPANLNDEKEAGSVSDQQSEKRNVSSNLYK